uniref:HDC04000 n=1 Tax=Drosophila melanogaster TaxID=7227 RepID=Q6IGZ9_DROME|eukprot:NP_001033964.1 uncharacterized protein Dmel_CG34029 [Drosophila melanogaster]
MESPDNRLYMCTACFKRFLWSELSRKELRCAQCRLSTKICVICDKKFEPREMSQVYCKQCNFYIERHAVVKPPPLGVQIGKPAEMTSGPGTEGSSITERWKEIKAAAGIVDDFD